MLSLLGRGVGLGFAAGTIPGALHTYLVNETLIQGWRRSIVIIFSPLITDIPIIALVVFLLGQLPDTAVSGLQVFGGLFILTLAHNAWQQARAEQVTLTEGDDAPKRFTLTKALMVNLLNPAPYIYWGTVGGPILLEGLDQSLGHGAAFLLGFYGTFLGIMAGFVFIFDRMRGLGDTLIRRILKFTALLLVFLSLMLIADALAIL